MMNRLDPIDTAMVFMYLAAMALIGLYALRKRRNVEDYYVGGRKSGPFVLACLWMTSWIGGATVIGSVDKAFSSGLTAIWYTGSMAVGCIIFAFTSSRLIHGVGSRFRCLTYPELIELRYGPLARLIATVTTFLAYVAYTAGQFLAMAQILSSFLGWDPTLAICVSAGSIVVYTALGGFIAVTITGVAQAMIMAISLALIMSPLLLTKAGGFGAMATALPQGFLNAGTWGWGTILGMMVSIVFTFYTSMDGYTRCFAAKDAASAKNGTLLAAGLVAIMALSSTLVGLVARTLVETVPPGTSVMGAMMALMPAGLRGFILIGLLAAIMSTGSVCILVASANITQDIYKRFVNKSASSSNLLLLGGLAGVAVGVLSAYLAIARQDVIDVLYIAFTVNSAGLFIPTICAFVWDKGGAAAASLSMGLSLFVVIFWYVAQSIGLGSIFTALDPVWPGLAVSAAVYAALAVTKPLTEGERRKLAELRG